MRWWNRILRAAGYEAETDTRQTASVSGPLLVQMRTSWFRSPAHGRALALLREHLSPAQRALFDSSGYFDVVGSQTGTRYRIRIGRISNIDVYGVDGAYVRSLCFAPSGNLPLGDVLLAQKLALEGFEPETLAVANAGIRLYA